METTTDSQVISRFKELQEKYDVNAKFKVGFNKELSPDVKELITYLKGDLNPEDIVPGSPTELYIGLRDKQDLSRVDTFIQGSTTFMEAFDQNQLTDFFNKYLK